MVAPQRSIFFSFSRMLFLLISFAARRRGVVLIVVSYEGALAFTAGASRVSTEDRRTESKCHRCLASDFYKIDALIPS
jgi:hypothetical protein